MVDFSFSPQKVWNLDVSISSRIMRFVCTISLSLLETRENTFGFLFSSRNWRKYLKFLHFFCKSSRSLLEPENRSRYFSFLFSKIEMWIQYFSFSSRFDFLASRQCLKPVSQHLLSAFTSLPQSLHKVRRKVCPTSFLQAFEDEVSRRTYLLSPPTPWSKKRPGAPVSRDCLPL